MPVGPTKHIDSEASAESRRKKRMKSGFCAPSFIAALTVISFVCVLLIEDNGRLCTPTSFAFASLFVLPQRALRRSPRCLFEGCISEKKIFAFHIFIGQK